MTDHRPANCRLRLMEEGKPYPRSSCSGCGTSIVTGLKCPLVIGEADGDVTVHPTDHIFNTVGKGSEPEKQEIWETREFLFGMSHALKGYPLDPNKFAISTREFDLIRKGWNFGNAIAKPLLARIEMEKD